MNIRRTGTALAWVLALCGCVHFTPRPLDAEKELAGFDQRSLGDPKLCSFVAGNLAASAGSAVPGKWNLETLTLAAFYFHSDLDVARAKWDEAQAAVRSAGERPNPSLGVSAMNNASAGGGVSPWVLGLNVDFSIETAGKRGHHMAQSRLLADVARQEFVSSAWAVRARVRQAMLEYGSAQRQAAALAGSIAAQADVLKLAQVERDAGESSGADFMREQTALEQLRLTEQEAKGRIAQTRVALAAAVGVPAQALDAVQLDFTGFEHAPVRLAVGEVRHRALLGRADILAALSEYAASEEALKLEIAKQYPDLRIGPGYEYDQGDNKWGLGIGLDLPILNRNEGAIAGAEAHRRAVAAKFSALQASVIESIDSACTSLASQQATLDAAVRVTERTRQQLELAERMYKLGESTGQTVALARAENVRAEMTRLDAQEKVQKSQGDLESALQRPLDLPLSPATLKAVERKSP